MIDPSVAAASIVAITILVVHWNKLTMIIKSMNKSHRARWEARRISRIRHGEDEDVRPIVSGIFIHPVKSLQPVALLQTQFDQHGLVADRRLMIVRPNPKVGEISSHRFFTQRQSPSLATIEATEPIVISDDDGKEKKTLIKLSSSLLPDSHVYINIHPSTLNVMPVRYIAGIWSDTVEVIDVGDEAAAFVAKIVSIDDPSFGDVRVVSLSESSVRAVDARYCPDAARVGLFGCLPQGGLTDGFPILIATQASLDELNRRLNDKGKDQLPMSRFRPNIVIGDTSKPFDEDNWKMIQIGKGKNAVILHMSKGCPRCKQSCTDQITGKRGDEPLETLSDFRVLGTSDVDVFFAQNAVLNGDSYRSSIRVGDPVSILTRGNPCWDLETSKAE